MEETRHETKALSSRAAANMPKRDGFLHRCAKLKNSLLKKWKCNVGVKKVSWAG